MLNVVFPFLLFDLTKSDLFHKLELFEPIFIYTFFHLCNFVNILLLILQQLINFAL